METVICYRPTGEKELELVKKSGYKKWPPRLPEQPIFYPVTNEEYALALIKRGRNYFYEQNKCPHYQKL